ILANANPLDLLSPPDGRKRDSEATAEAAKAREEGGRTRDEFAQQLEGFLVPPAGVSCQAEQHEEEERTGEDLGGVHPQEGDAQNCRDSEELDSGRHGIEPFTAAR